jgi:hypothetical protein
MDWKMQGSTVIHTSGFSVSVHNGSFASPFEISFSGDDGLSPVMLARMIRDGLFHGQLLERVERRPEPSRAEQSPTTVVYKRRRSHSGKRAVPE